MAELDYIKQETVTGAVPMLNKERQYLQLQLGVIHKVHMLHSILALSKC